MVQLSALVALFAMGSSIMANPVDISGSVDVGITAPIDAVHVARDNTNGEGAPHQGANPNLDTSLARAGGRGGGGGADMAAGIVEIAATVFKAVWHIGNDIECRKAFTQEVVRETAAKYPGHNIVVCNVGYSLKGDGWQEVTSVTYDAKIGRPVTYDVIVFNSPKTFERHGDGGFQNWAYLAGKNCHTNGGYIDCPRH